MATEAQLTAWRRHLLIRDAVVVHQRPGERALHAWHCPICGPSVYYRAEALQAHHIHPKSLYPEMALRLDNGILACTACHQGAVHDFNASADVRLRSRNFGNRIGWERWVRFFSDIVNRPSPAKYNRENQSKLTP